MLENSLAYFASASFSKSVFSKNSFRNTISVLKSLDPNQAPYFVGLDLGPNCLQRLSADKTGRQRIKYALKRSSPVRQQGYLKIHHFS